MVNCEVELKSFDSVSLWERMSRFFSPCHARNEAATFVEQLIDGIRAGCQHCISLADRFITVYRGDRVLTKEAQKLDRIVTAYLFEGGDERVLHSKNQEKLDKWVGYGFPKEVFFRFHDFTNWMERTLLTSQMKVTHHREFNTVHIVGGEPAIYVTLPGEDEPRLMGWRELDERFEVDTENEYRNLGEVFIRDRETKQVFTYLDNGRGLEPHHPYEVMRGADSRLNPISGLSGSQSTIDPSFTSGSVFKNLPDSLSVAIVSIFNPF